MGAGGLDSVMVRSLAIEATSQGTQNISRGNAPGPDSLPAEFYKTFQYERHDKPCHMKMNLFCHL